MREHVRERSVYTWEPDGWPAGLITWYPAEGGPVLEHVVAFKPSDMRHLVRAGLDFAWRQGYAHVRFQIPAAHPHHRALSGIGRVLGFHEYEPDWWIKHRD